LSTPIRNIPFAGYGNNLYIPVSIRGYCDCFTVFVSGGAVSAEYSPFPGALCYFADKVAPGTGV
jgi:hypothetical protein